MSAVGPRPLTDSDVQRHGWGGPEFDFRWETRPGLTGLAQIVGAQSAEDTLELDRGYTAGWHPILDCQLIALSFAVNAFGKSAVQRFLQQSRFFARQEPSTTKGTKRTKGNPTGVRGISRHPLTWPAAYGGEAIGERRRPDKTIGDARFGLSCRSPPLTDRGPAKPGPARAALSSCPS